MVPYSHIIILVFSLLCARGLASPSEGSESAKQDCRQHYSFLLNDAKILHKNEQGIVFKSFYPEINGYVTVKAEYYFPESRVPFFPQMADEEVEVMHQLSQLANEKLSKGFPRLFGAFKCSPLLIDDRRLFGQGFRLYFDPNGPQTSLYIMSELLEHEVGGILNDRNLEIQEFSAYLLQTLMALQVAQKQLNFLGRDLSTNIMLYENDQDSDSESSESKWDGDEWFAVKLPDGDSIYMRKSVTGGRYTKIGDFGQSALTTINGKRIDTLSQYQGLYGEMGRDFDERIDLITVVNDFIMETNMFFFEGMKIRYPEAYSLFLDLIKKVLGPTLRASVTTKRFTHLLFITSNAHFISAWKMKGRVKILEDFMRNCRYSLANDGGYSLTDAVQHPFFKHVFSERVPSDVPVEYLSDGYHYKPTETL